VPFDLTSRQPTVRAEIQLQLSVQLEKQHVHALKRWRKCWGVLSLIVLAQSSIQVHSVSAQESAPLRFEEARSLVLPETLDVVGAAPLLDGTVWIWTRNPGTIYEWVSGRGGLSAFPFDGRIISAAGTGVSRQVEVVDGLRPAITLMTEHKLSARRGLPLVLALDAMREANRWLVVGTDSLGEVRLLRCDGATCERVHARLPASLLKQHLVRLALIGSAPVLMEVDDPFRFLRFDGTQYARVTSREIRALLASVQKNGRWVALTPVNIGTECILAFSDLRSDSRVVVALDEHAQLLRHTVLDVPLGFMAVQPNRQTVIAARRGAQLELVEYRYAR
jgi:hypothetical protein